MKRIRIVLLTAARLLTALLLQPRAAYAAVFNVTTTADSGAGSLRQAIIDANANAAADVINLPADT